MCIAGEKSRHAVCVVIMAVGENAQFHTVKVNAQVFCISGKTSGSTGVQQDFMSVVFNPFSVFGA